MNANPESHGDDPERPDIGKQFRLAAAFLTRLPVEQADNDDADYDAPPADLARAMWLFPVVGVGIGGVGAIALALLAWANIPPAVAATLAIGITIWLTGALHEDGLADLADGFGGGQSREQKLEIMHDSRLGTYGALSLAVITVAKIAALASIAAVDTGAAAGALIAATAWSRAMFAPTMRWLPPARDDGLSALAGTPNEGETWKGLALGALLAALMLITPAGGGVIIILAAGGAGAFVVGWLALRQIDGYTGDVLGGVQQAAEAAMLIVASAVIIGNAA
ncbi:MAG: adenosylcobinamide-GDP ribazoletransferase [Alphaproteobacteria bacterium]|nr:adenosylcobinamide-GDP ribazoletransferase [Alphaproteobacteria bacterium]